MSGPRNSKNSILGKSCIAAIASVHRYKFGKFPSGAAVRPYEDLLNLNELH